MKTDNLTIKQIKVEDLIPYVNNPRKNDEAVNMVASSIAEFGFKVPVIVDKDNIVVAGHTRLKAAKKLGIDIVPCIIADDLTPAQIKAFRLADNKVGEMAGWDYALLDIELEDISDIDMSEFGFDTDEEWSEEDFEKFFSDTESNEKKVKTITCPHCGEVIEL